MTSTETTETPTESTDSGPKQLRDALAREKDENATLREALKLSIFDGLGIDTGDGVGALLFKSYDGEVTKEAIKATAEQYGIIGGGSPPPVEPTETQAQVAAHQAVSDQVRAASTPVPSQPPSPTEELANQIAEAEQAGNWERVVLLKAQRQRAG